MHKVFLGIGGNIGNKENNFTHSLNLIEKRLGRIILLSAVYETSPWGFQSDNNFWNQVIYIETGLEPEKLLYEINRIETEFGRKRNAGGYLSREMDIDILYFDNLILENETLIIPHPQIQRRLFVLAPLVEIAPDFIHPVLQLTNSQLLENCSDTSTITKIKAF
jgi:2-amino-4-hydroxy-6-hydroxymethyldihydropteridine diphosphokinase